MTRRTATGMVAVVLLAAAAIFLLQRHAPRRPPPTTVPDVAMTQLNGAPLRLADYRGKVVLLDFWASWCSPCREEIPRFVEWQTAYEARGLQVIGVAMDDNPAAAETFRREYRIDYPVVAGSAQLADRFGGILGLPVNIVIARDGAIVARHVGLVDPGILRREIEAQLAR